MADDFSMKTVKKMSHVRTKIFHPDNRSLEDAVNSWSHNSVFQKIILCICAYLKIS